MKAFFVGLLALFVIAVLAGLGVLLYPFFDSLGPVCADYLNCGLINSGHLALR